MVYSVLFYFIVGIFYRWNILSILSYFITGLFYRGNFLLLEYFTTGMFLYYSGFLHLCLRVCCRKCFGPNLGQSIKKKENLSKVSLIALGSCFKPIVEFRFGPQPNFKHIYRRENIFAPAKSK